MIDAHIRAFATDLRGVDGAVERWVVMKKRVSPRAARSSGRLHKEQQG